MNIFYYINFHNMSTVIFPEEHKYLTFLKKVFRHEFRKNGFRRISTSILENWVFRKNAEKGIMKAYIENNLSEQIQPVYYYYIWSFLDNWIEENRIGWDIIWENDPILDAIMIYVNYSVLNKIWLKDTYEIKINSFWTEKERQKYNEELVNFYSWKKHLLSEKSLELLETNPIMLLVSEEEDEKILAKSCSQMTKCLKKDSKEHFLKVKEYLDILNIPYIEDNTLIWRNSYNTNTVWSFIEKETWNTISYWARYNALSTELWTQKEIPASWFYTNSKILIEMLKWRWISIRNKDEIDLFFIQLWDEAKKIVFPVSIAAREAWIKTVVSLWTPSLKEQMLKAQRSWAKFIVIVWVMEARNWVFQVRDNISWTQEEVKKENLLEHIITKIWEKSLDFYSPEKDLLM